MAQNGAGADENYVDGPEITGRGDLLAQNVADKDGHA